MDTTSELLEIWEILTSASKYGLESEVVWSALSYIKKNPDKSISEAINHGYNEWIK